MRSGTRHRSVHRCGTLIDSRPVASLRGIPHGSINGPEQGAAVQLTLPRAGSDCDRCPLTLPLPGPPQSHCDRLDQIAAFRRDFNC